MWRGWRARPGKAPDIWTRLTWGTKRRKTHLRRRGSAKELPAAPALALMSSSPAPLFSGFLPAGSLVEVLIHASTEVASMEKLPLLQACNVSSAIRRIKLVSSLFEELRERESPLPPSSVLCLTELLSTIRRTQALVEECAAGSALWSLLQTEVISQRFHGVVREMGRALDALPLGLLDVTVDVREQVELLRKQAGRASVFVDPQERRLSEELVHVLKGGRGNKGNSGGEGHRRGVVERKMEEIAWRVELRSSSACDEEIVRLEAEMCRQAGTGGLVAVRNIKTLISMVSDWKKCVAFVGGGGDGEEQGLRVPSLLASPPSTSSSFCLHSSQPCDLSGVTPYRSHLSQTNQIAQLISSSSSSSFGEFGSRHLSKATPCTSHHQQADETACPTSSFSSSSAAAAVLPDEFRCPITLELMREPVIVESGHTYERSAITRWINSGHHTCPKTGLSLIHTALIPNYALKSMIHQWCQENTFPVSSPSPSPASHTPIDQISALRVADEAVKATAEFLVGRLATGSPEAQQQAAYELRLLAKSGMEPRRMAAEAGAIPFLVTLLGSGDPWTQENAVTALLNLSIFDNNKLLIVSAGAVDSVVEVLRAGVSMEARENAAATLFSLSMVEECRVAIGARPGAIHCLLGLLREGTARGKRDAALALHSLALCSANKTKVVAAGAVPLLVELLVDDKAGITDDALSLLAVLGGSSEGLEQLAENGAAVPVLADLLRLGTAKGKENAVCVLLGLCKKGGEEMCRRLWRNPRSVSSLLTMSLDGSPRAKRKTEALLRLLNRYSSESRHPAG